MFDALEARLAAAPVDGEPLTIDDLAAIAEAEADFAHGRFTVDPATSDATAVEDKPAPKRFRA
ncbi:MAG: hypothetical protein ACREQ5_20690 [Candidatus Dormibacteria bacterium]